MYEGDRNTRSHRMEGQPRARRRWSDCIRLQIEHPRTLFNHLGGHWGWYT
jgi:hypothetical protein